MDNPTSHTSAEAAGGAPERTIGELIASISEQVSALVRREIDYTVASAKAKGKELGLGGGMFGAAAFLAIFGFLMLLLAAAAGIAVVLPWWAGFLIVGGVLLLIAAILGIIGKSRLDKSKKYDVNPKAGVNRSVDALKKGFQK